jgi:hypothetical protein
MRRIRPRAALDESPQIASRSASLMALDPAFEKRMKQAESEVEREFAMLDPEQVRREFARVAEELMSRATVTDFVPVLVHRHVRDNLRLVASA